MELILCPEQFRKYIEETSFDFLTWLTKVALCMDFDTNCRFHTHFLRKRRKSQETNDFDPVTSLLQSVTLPASRTATLLGAWGNPFVSSAKWDWLGFMEFTFTATCHIVPIYRLFQTKFATKICFTTNQNAYFNFKNNLSLRHGFWDTFIYRTPHIIIQKFVVWTTGLPKHEQE